MNRIASAALALVAATAAHAQLQPFDPSLLDRQQRDNQRLQDERERLLAPPRRAVEPPARPAVRPTAPDAKFVLQAVDFGPSVFLTPAELQALVAPYVGREVTFGSLNDILDKVNALYAERGQVFSRALLPPQRVDDGRVRINLVESRADGIEVSGNQYVSADWIDRLVDVRNGETIDALQLDRTLDRFQRSSEARFAIDVEPGTVPGSSKLKVKVAEPERWKLRASAGNEGNDSTGREQLSADLALFSPLGRGDRAGVGLVTSRGLKSLSLSYGVPLNTVGTRLSLAGATARTHIVEGPFAPNDIRGKSQSASALVVHPLFDRRPWSLEGFIGYGLSRSSTSITGVDLGTSRVRQTSVGLQASRRDAVDDLSASVSWVPYRAEAAAGGVTDSAKIEWSASYVRRVEGQGAFLGRINGQTHRSSTPLAGVGQLSWGGAGLLRAYPAGTLVGDSGYGLSLEWHSAVSETLGWNVFTERAVVWGSVPRAALADIGAGVEWRALPKLTVSATAAHGLNTNPTGSGRSRLYVKAVYEF
jgi:hemolysin activation/secretion protein